MCVCMECGCLWRCVEACVCVHLRMQVWGPACQLCHVSHLAGDPLEVLTIGGGRWSACLQAPAVFNGWCFAWCFGWREQRCGGVKWWRRLWWRLVDSKKALSAACACWLVTTARAASASEVGWWCRLVCFACFAPVICSHCQFVASRGCAAVWRVLRWEGANFSVGWREGTGRHTQAALLAAGLVLAACVDVS